MLADGGGGGSISVDPSALDTLAAQISGVTSGTSSTRGQVAGAASAAAGCQDPAAGSFARLQSLLAGALTCLDECSVSISKATSAAAAAYVTTDTTQIPMTINSCPAGP
jgi:hypothetical protein